MIPKKLIDEIERWMKEHRYGNIQINFADGHVRNFNVSESIRITDVETISISTTTISTQAPKPQN